MSAEDVENLKGGFEAFARGDYEAAYRRLAPDFELHDHVILEDSTEIRGPEAMVANQARLREAFADISYEILDVVDLDGRVLLRVETRARIAREGGIDTRLEVGHLWTVRDGLAVRCEIFPSWQEAKRAVGLDR